MITVVVMTNGRMQYMREAMASLNEQVHGPITRWVIHDDSGDGPYQLWLRKRYPGWEVVTSRTGSYSGAYHDAWRWLHDHDANQWIFQTEDDFTYNVPVDLRLLTEILGAHPHIAQMQLRRQPWGAEPADGGFVGQWPHFYTDAGDGEHHWLEHRRNWSSNPGLFRRALCAEGWPLAPGSEQLVGDRILAARPDATFALWGRREDAPTVHHIGQERKGRID